MENSKKIIEHENNELCKLININEDACEFYSSAQEKLMIHKSVKHSRIWKNCTAALL